MPTDLRAQLQLSLGDAYTIERELGGGGMSHVYLATEVRFARQVVVKLLAPEQVAELSVERFEREVLLAAQLQQANIVPVLSAGDCSGLPYYLMPYIDGESLRHRLLRGPLGIGETVGILRDVARALAYAHDRGIVHRDIKPENVLLSGSAAVVTDFGIAKALHDAKSSPRSTTLTAAGTSMGTPAYMSPEQAVGDEVDAHADVYSWGLMAYEMLDGKHPFCTKTSVQELVTAHLTEMPPSINDVRGDVPDALAQLIMQSLSKPRNDRPANGSALLRAIDDVTVLATPSRVSGPTAALPVDEVQPVLQRSTPAAFVTGSNNSPALASPVSTNTLSSRLGRTAAVLATMLVVAALVYTQRERLGALFSPNSASIASDKSIAVLPFVNLSADKDQEYFSDGITEELINLLARSNDLRVAARTSAFKFKDVKLDVKEVARQLHVGYVLEGSVRKSGNIIRVTAQLIKAADGFPLWSESYDRKLDDIFAVQDEICDKAVKALQATLLGNALTASSKPHNPDAYNLVLQGRHFLADRTPENITRAIDYFQQALARDSTNAAAYSGLARAYTVQAGQGWIPVADGYNQSRTAALKAIALDPQLAEAWVALGYVQNIFDWEWAAADSSYKKALALEPGNAETLRTAALLSAKLGRLDDAIRGLRQAIERDPLLAGAYSALAFMLDASGRSAEAEPEARKALELGPTGILRHFNIARALVFQGKNDGALQEIEQEKGESWRLMGLAIVYHAQHRKAESDKALAEYTEKNASHAAMQIADVHAFRGEMDEAFVWLERAYEQHDAGVADIKDDPWLKNIRGDARYVALLKKVRLPE